MKKPWFKPKMFGVGAGLPCSWEGWLLLAAFAGTVFAGVWLGRQIDSTPARFIVPLVGLALASAVFIPIIIARTEGGWRWRWGGHDR